MHLGHIPYNFCMLFNYYVQAQELQEGGVSQCYIFVSTLGNQTVLAWHLQTGKGFCCD